MDKLSDPSAILAKYDYLVPAEAIAQKPASPRDSSKFLVYDRASDKRMFDVFANLPCYLPKKAVLVFNETKVIPARMVLRKETGGKAVIIFIEKSGGNLIKVMSDRALRVGSRLELAKRIFFEVIKQEGKFYFLRPLFSMRDFPRILARYGITPIPPYIKKSPLSEDELRKKYQTVFARKTGSIAAPTASLHFTKRLMNKIKKAGASVKFVTLHVNLGTFAPLNKDHLEKGRLHEEFYSIGEQTARFLNKAKRERRPIIAVGTTVVRTLESAADNSGKLAKLSGKTDLFIREGYKFKFVDQLITNFHVPRSSLLMLVSAFVPRKALLDIYSEAIARKFRLFSFGDGMYIM